ncbi:MAG: hypothetical protein HLUCCA12_12185 [Rhodobacteraceae bacterium HLUCCA12]|nr:MAG: hypothetical protein HLUCCA12_12185 [Rhodobacteraceae bacterium HLUCCA12]
MYPDGDRPLKITPPQEVIGASIPQDSATMIAAFIQSTKLLADLCEDVMPGDSWRIETYRSLYAILSETKHAGTGSVEELQIHRALDILAKMLRVANA